MLLTGLHHLALPTDEGLNLNVPGLPPVSLLPDLSYLAPNCFHPSQKLHAKSKEFKLLKLMFIVFLWFYSCKNFVEQSLPVSQTVQSERRWPLVSIKGRTKLPWRAERKKSQSSKN